VAVIHQIRSGHGRTDTRRKPGGGYIDGLGRGVFRLYTNAAGEVTGHAWSTLPGSIHHASSTRPVAIGRLVRPDKK
jgi:hypothetical protein